MQGRTHEDPFREVSALQFLSSEGHVNILECTEVRWSGVARSAICGFLGTFGLISIDPISDTLSGLPKANHAEAIDLDMQFYLPNTPFMLELPNRHVAWLDILFDLLTRLVRV